MRRPEKLSLLFSRFFRLQTGVATRCKFGAELLDSSGRVDEFQLARIKRMASVADINLHFGPSTAGLKRVPATARDGRFEVFGVYTLFHRIILPSIAHWESQIVSPVD